MAMLPTRPRRLLLASCHARYKAARRAMAMLCQSESLGLASAVVDHSRELYRALGEVRVCYLLDGVMHRRGKAARISSEED